MQRVAIERILQTEIPALLHDRNRADECRLLLWSQHALVEYRDEAGHRLPLAGDDIFFARLDLANAARKGLVGFAQADYLAHSANPGQPRSRSEARSSWPKPISTGTSRATACPSRVMMYSSPASTSRTHCSKVSAASSTVIVFTLLSIDPAVCSAHPCYIQVGLTAERSALPVAFER